jgi:hypothetical protein
MGLVSFYISKVSLSRKVYALCKSVLTHKNETSIFTCMIWVLDKGDAANYIILYYIILYYIILYT